MMDKCLFISKSALEYNINHYLTKTNKEIIAVVKNNAYGHGVEEILSILEAMLLSYSYLVLPLSSSVSFIVVI